MPKCPRCQGSGINVFDDPENWKRYNDDCYHCGATGVISAETLRSDKLDVVIYTLARQIVADIKNNDEEWFVHASESVISEREYRLIQEDREAEIIQPEVSGLSRSVQDALISLFVPSEVESPIKPHAHVSLVPSDSNEVPF